MTDLLWEEASLDHDAMAREASLARAEAELTGVMPYFFASRSWPEYAHRRALAEERLTSIALRSGLTPQEMTDLADMHMGLYVQAMTKTALEEGQDPLDAVLQAPAGGYGSGPERPDEHSTQADFSNDYAEIPQGAPGGPPPQVVTPQFGRPQAPEEVTASRRTAAPGWSPGKASLRRTAQDPMAGGTAPGAGADSANLPAGVTQGDLQPDGTQSGGGLPPPPAAPGHQASRASADPVALQVSAVAASVQFANPGLPQSECRRVARRVVSRYLHADLESSVTSDDPGGGSGGSGGGGDSGGGGGAVEHMLEGQGLRSLLPGTGGGAGLADAAELAAL